MSIQGVAMISGVIALLFTAVFLLDVLTPLGLPLSVFYVVPLALTSLLRRREAPYWLAGASSAATLVGYFLSSSLTGVPNWLPVTNRGIGLALFWLTAAVIRRQQDMADHLVHVAALESENRAHLMKEQALQRQADEIQDLYNRAPCGYHSLDPTGRYVEVNDTELQWLGCRREDVVGQIRFRDFLAPQSARRFDEIFPRFVAQGSIHDLDLDLMRKDGSLLPVSLSATAIRDSEGRYIASRSTIVDITERRRTEEVLRQTHETLETQVRDRTAELAAANRRLEEQLEESRRTEEALRVSESRFRLTADHAPVLIWISDSTKACTWFNKPWLEFVGRRMEQEVGNGWVDNVHPEDVARCVQVYTDSFDARRAFTMEYRLRRHDGAWRWVLDHGIPRYEADGSFAGYIGSCTEIHDRKRVEELQGRLAAIVESSSDAIVSASLDGTVRTWNDGAHRMFGYGADEMVGRSIRTVIPAERHAEETDMFARVTRGERIDEYETIRIRKDRTALDVSITASPVRDSQGRVIGLAKIVRDITVRKRMDAALRQKNELIELSHEPIFSWDVEGGIIEWNRGCEQLYGFTRTEAVNRQCQDLLSTVFPEPLDGIMAKLRFTGEWSGELLQRTKDHREVIVESRWGCIEQDGRRIVLETNRDITERKKAETLLIKKNKDLETLLYVTSHDLKEPLRAIEGFSQLVLERYADRLDASGGDYLRRVVRATQRLDRLLNDILELSRAQRMLPPMEEVEAEVLVKEALNRLDNRIKETGATVHIVPPLPRLRVNRMWATQGLYNLLANAMKFTRDGHPPDIEVASYKVPAPEAPFAGVVVKDRGPGVPTRHAERIFMLFQRAVGRDVEGTGAGLAIVRQVAERHGGRAWVQPRAGGGSEFVITFACPTHNNYGGASPR
ncbi:MAG TPA: PAS domain S-box protein [Nitrospiraceae bacterium]|nr:PAS domain S-box protein [Nitrospiraceae bacterium]